jgi:hypothetical protein
MWLELCRQGYLEAHEDIEKSCQIASGRQHM